MKTNPNKATPRVYHTLRQIVQRVPRWLIEKTANAYGVEARKFSATSHFVMLILGHLSRASCLTEICDDADLNKRKLSLVRNATPGRRNTFSHANRTRSSEVAEEVYWETARHLGEVTPGFIPPKRVRGFLSRFRDRGIFAIDSTVIKLALSCIASYPYRSKKAAAKMHARLPIGSFIPSVVRIEAGKPHDSTMADGLTKDMKGVDILLADRAYVDFLFLHNLAARDVFWGLRQKVNMLYEAVERREVSGDVVSDEIVRLTAANTAVKYPQTFRRVRAIVEVNGEKREMTFLTNNTKWAASTVCELYRARWEIEVFVKELKQTLQLADFIGTNKSNNYFVGPQMQDNAAVDLSEITDPWYVKSGGSNLTTCKYVTFADGARVNVNLGGRKVPGNEAIMTWDAESKPANLATLTFKGVFNDRIVTLSKREDGLYMPRGLVIIVK